ncbi:MAG: hypothetical protein AAFR96_10250 [Planctomycetota bacterium]
MRSLLTTAAIAAALSAPTAHSQLTLTTSYTLPSNVAFDVQADGRLLLIDGDGDVLQQDAVNSTGFTLAGSIAPLNPGNGAPSFVSISPDGQSVAIGDNVFGPANAVSIFDTADLTSPGVSSPLSTITTPNFAASWSDNSTLFVTGAISSPFTTVVNRLDATNGTSETVISPAGGSSGGVNANGNELLIGAGDSGDVRSFDIAALSTTAADFSTGTFIAGSGSAGSIDTFGSLLLIAGSGGVQVIDRVAGTTLTLAPLGSSEFYGGFFNPSQNQIIVTNSVFDTNTFVPTTTIFAYTIPAPATLALAPLALAATRRRRA